MEGLEPTGWCILRCAGRDTLRLAGSLVEDGFEAWTPTETRVIEARRARMKRTSTLPILPSYIFAAEVHLPELRTMARLDVKPRRGEGRGKPAHASFSLMRYGEDVPLISDLHLQGLRQVEELLTPRKRKNRPEALPVGMSVQLEPGHHGSFSGVALGVERSDGRVTKLGWIGNGMRIAISTSLLVSNPVGA